jgi:hypothetical protein
MEWWQIFGIVFLVFFGLYFFTVIAQAENKKKETEKLSVMADPYENGQWIHPDEIKDGRSGGRGLQRQQETSDADESVITRLPKVVNERLNQKLTKSTLKDKVEIGKLQVEHITNANKYADQYFDLENKSKTNKAKGLELDKRIRENESSLKDVQTMDTLRELENKNKTLDLHISIAEKEERLNGIKNQPRPVQPLSREEKRAKERSETEAQIGKLEDAMRDLKANELLSDDARQVQLNQIQNKLFDLYQKRIELL